MDAHFEEPPDDLIPVAEAAQQLKIGLNRFYSWIRRGQIRAWKLVSRLYVSQAALRELYKPVGAAPHPETVTEARTRREHRRQALESLGLGRNGLG